MPGLSRHPRSRFHVRETWLCCVCLPLYRSLSVEIVTKCSGTCAHPHTSPCWIMLTLLRVSATLSDMTAWLRAVPGLCYGGDYNPEQWPESVWSEDMAL